MGRREAGIATRVNGPAHPVLAPDGAPTIRRLCLSVA